MPSFAASFGEWMLTAFPWKMTWPLSAECVPAMHFTRVDLPAPLSPTSAITSPGRTSKSTSVSAWTEPNDLVRSRIWRSGWLSLIGSKMRWRRPTGRLHRCCYELLAVLPIGTDAHVAPLQELVREEARVVVLRDPDDRQSQGRLRMLAVRPGSVRLRLLAFEERDRSLCGGVRLVGHVLIDRAGLPAGDDVLDTLDARLLTGERERLEPLRLQVRDDRAGDVVGRRQHALDVVVRLHQHLVEDGRRVVRVPVGHELLRPPLELVCREERIEDGDVARLEPVRVLVRLAAPQLSDGAGRLVGAVRLHCRDDAGGLGLAHGLAVEGDVDRRRTTGDLAVIVDRLAALRGEELLDRRGGAVVERRLDDDLRARCDACLRLRLLLERVVQGVRDRRLDAGLLEGGGHGGLVELHPAHRRLGVREQDADVHARGPVLRARRRGSDDEPRCDDGKDAEHRDGLLGELPHANPPDTPNSGGSSGTILLSYGISSSRADDASPGRDRKCLAIRRAFVPRARRQVAGDVLPRDEVEPRVRVRRGDQATAVAVEEELQHRQEPLQVRLLVDREVEVAVLDRAKGCGEQVVPTRADTVLVQAVRTHHVRDSLRRPGIDREQAAHVPVRAVERLD